METAFSFKGTKIAIDLDGTLHNTNDREEGFRMGKPFPGSREALLELRRMGYEIVVFTCRADKDTEHIRHWLSHFQIPYDEITNIKPRAAYYIDDNAIKFEGNWIETIKQIKENNERL